MRGQARSRSSPTNEAFAELPSATLEALAADPEMLKSILLNHAAPVVLNSIDLATTSTAKTMAGQDLTIRSLDGKLMIGPSTVIESDYKCSNGVLHVIDKILLPGLTR